MIAFSKLPKPDVWYSMTANVCRGTARPCGKVKWYGAIRSEERQTWMEYCGSCSGPKGRRAAAPDDRVTGMDVRVGGVMRSQIAGRLNTDAFRYPHSPEGGRRAWRRTQRRMRRKMLGLTWIYKKRTLGKSKGLEYTAYEQYLEDFSRSHRIRITDIDGQPKQQWRHRNHRSHDGYKTILQEESEPLSQDEGVH